MCRRDLFKVGLDDTCKPICGSKQPVGLELFGDDLTDQLKTVKENNKAAKQLTAGHKRKSGEEYSRSSYSARSFFFLISSTGESPSGIPPKKNQLLVESQRQPECELHLQGEEICDTEVTPEAVRQIPLLSVKSEKTCPPVLAGRIQHFLGKWKQLTHDPSILNAVMGYKIDFLLTPVQFTIPITINFSAQESANVNARISKFLEKGIVVKSSHEEGEFISSIFLRPEKDESFRMILNLKDLKTFVRFHHFKMDSIHTCSQLKRPRCYMAFIDLRDAYYSGPIAKEHQKCLKLMWQGNMY